MGIDLPIGTWHSATVMPGLTKCSSWLGYCIWRTSEKNGVYESSVRLAVKATQALNGMQNRLYEEELTACFLGGIVASLPLSTMAFGHSDESRTSFG